MQPLEILRNEHGLIRQYLDNLALAAEKPQEDEHPPKELEFQPAAYKAGADAFEKSHKLVVDTGSMLVHM